MDRPHKENWFTGYFKYVSNNSAIHGVRYLGLKDISRAERILWLIINVAAIMYSHYLIRTNLDRFIANPTVVTIKKDFRNWENPFPAVTGCFVNKVDPEKAHDYILRKWGISTQHEKYNHYMDFVKTIAKLTYVTFPNLLKFRNDPELNDVDMLELVMEVYPNITGSLVTFQSKVKTDWQIVLTEMGLCFSLNSGFADLLSPSYIRSKNLISGNKKEFLKCHYLNGLCYARYDSDPNMPIEYHIHSNLEVIHSTSEAPIQVGVSQEVEVNYRLTETHSSPEIRYLSADQRKCRFDDEPNTKKLPVYSTSICLLECRSRWTLKMCGCKPYFYHFIEGKVCDVQGLLCLISKFSVFLETFDCECSQPCNLMVYLRQSPKITKWEAGYFDQRITFRWGLIPPTTKYHRKILFGFQDLIVSLGGILSLFMGMSFISFQESFYLFGQYLRLRRESKKKHEKLIMVKESKKRRK